jgi:hypothetical protein
MSDEAKHYRTVAVRLPTAIADKVDHEAKAQLLSTAAYVRRTLAQATASPREWEREHGLG